MVEKAGVTPEKEFAFCTEKIEKNFSNYSSWHYRSKLLPLLYPNVEDPSRPISEEKLKEELELVLTAAFTDPNDSSAWFYQRWLLGYAQPELDLAACRIDAKQNLAVLSFSKPINLATGGYKLTVSCCDNCNEASKWMPATDGNTFDTTWTLRSAFGIKQDSNPGMVSIVTPDTKELTLQLQTIQAEGAVGVKKPKFGYEFGSAIVDVLKAQLASCLELLEYEPDSKWTLLTAALLMKAIDRRGYHETIRQHLTKLETVDALRKGYYLDLASKWAIENRLEQWIEAGKLSEGIDLSGLQLSVVHYTPYLATANAINLSGNRLVNRNLGVLRDLVFCRRLNLTNNAEELDTTVLKLPLVEEIIHNGNEQQQLAKELPTKVESLVL